MSPGLQRQFPATEGRGFGQYLLDQGLINASDLLRYNGILAHADCDLIDILLSENQIGQDQILNHYANWLGCPVQLAPQDAADPDLLAQFDPQLCLQAEALPLQLNRGVLHLALNRPECFNPDSLQRPKLTKQLRLLQAPRGKIQKQWAKAGRPQLVERASARVPSHESCRSWAISPLRRIVTITLACLTMLWISLQWPGPVVTLLTFWAALTLLAATGLKLAALTAYLRRPKPGRLPRLKPGWRRPKVSVLVPLYREPEVAQVLLQRLARLTYPKPLLDVLLLLEEGDEVTRNALAGATLPSWMRVLEVPEGQPRTKPRAMNYALDFCHGDIIGIYDAEDAPDPDQIDRVAARFSHAGPDLACLQGVLDYYNARQNWLARCFTVEYATWFRLMLPGMRRLGFAIPLGGTTLFFRRDALEKLGGWDAHNVTEDADLGIRLARHGYRTEMVATTTGEEANCHLLPWIKQRSRWLKGYMVTYLVHMRNPRRLLRELGGRQFLGFQLHFITALSQFLLAPLLWSLWLIVFGLPHPLRDQAPPQLLLAMGGAFIAVELITIAAGLIAVSGRRHRHLLPWVPSLHFYYPLGAIAAYKALFELVFQPFYWDKTKHGHSLLLPSLSVPPAAHRIELEPGHEGF